MLDWLKLILGETYTEEIDSKIAAEIGKNFVARADFNTVSTAKKNLEDTIKVRDEQLENLKGSESNVENLKNTITELQKQNKLDKEKYEADILKIRTDNAVEAALAAAGAKNVTAAKALLTKFLGDAEMADDGTVKGLDAEIKALVEGEATSFMFEAVKDNQQTNFKGMTPGNPGGNPPPAGNEAATYENRIAEARKSGNTAAAIAIKREAAENGVFLM